MNKTSSISSATEPAVGAVHHHLLCWKSAFAGLLIAIMGYMVLAALGAGVAGLSAESVIHHESNGSALATGAGLWLGLSAVIALFCGSYFALRISRFVTNKVGAAHGFVIASAFFILMIIASGGALGNIARGMANHVDRAHSMAGNTAIEDSIYKTMGSTATKANSQDVAQGLAMRFASDDLDSAKQYYAYQTGLPQAEADSKVTQMKSDFDQAAKVTAEKAARAVADIGWSLFVTFLAGLIGAVVGGRVGAHANIERPFAARAAAGRNETIGFSTPLTNQNGSALPYIFGWLLGVPTSILFLIFILRSVF